MEKAKQQRSLQKEEVAFPILTIHSHAFRDDMHEMTLVEIGQCESFG